MNEPRPFSFKIHLRIINALSGLLPEFKVGGSFREAVNGIRIEFENTHTNLIATDGRVLGVLRLDVPLQTSLPFLGAIMLPVNDWPKISGKCGNGVTINVEPGSAGGYGHGKFSVREFSGSLMNPKCGLGAWRSVLPHMQLAPCLSVDVNPELLAKVLAPLKALGFDKCIRIRSNGGTGVEAPYVITVVGSCGMEYAGLIMPIRIESEFPKWLAQEAVLGRKPETTGIGIGRQWMAGIGLGNGQYPLIRKLRFANFCDL